MTDVTSTQADELDSSNSISVVQMSSLGQSVIHSHQPSVIQTAGPNVQTIQVVRVANVEDDLQEDAESRKRREILSRRPSYRKILNELSSPVTKLEEESNSSLSQDGEDCATNLSHSGVQFQQVVPQGTIQITTNPDGTSVGQGLQTLTMTNASPTTSAATGATIVQYAQGPDGQFYIPGTMQAYQLASAIPQNIVLANSSTSLSSPGSSSTGEAVSRKREFRLLKNREAARDCRLKKKDYVKCLENRVAVLENQNKTLIEELKALKELYCQNSG